MTISTLSRIGLIFLAGFGVFAGGHLSLDHLAHGDVCPMIGPIPACLIVLIGYILMLLAAFIPSQHRKMTFYSGFFPVAVLAAMGVMLELTQGHICPPGPTGIPQCFISLAMVLLCLGLFVSYVRGPKRPAH